MREDWTASPSRPFPSPLKGEAPWALILWVRHHQRVTLTGSEGRRYRVARGISHNVVELAPDGRPVCSWCAHPPSAFGEEDCVISQVLTLLHDEAGFRRVANAGRAA